MVLTIPEDAGIVVNQKALKLECGIYSVDVTLSTSDGAEALKLCVKWQQEIFCGDDYPGAQVSGSADEDESGDGPPEDEGGEGEGGGEEAEK